MLLISHVWGIFSEYFPNIVKTVQVKRTSVELVVLPTKIVPIAKFLKSWSSTRFLSLIDIVAVDFLKEQKSRYRLIYIVENYKTGFRCLIHTILSNNYTGIASLVSVYKNANWSEREIYDLFGLQILNHPRLTRILTDYGFIGHPLRKDFPLIGSVGGKTIVRHSNTVWVLRGLPNAEDEK